MLCVSRPPHPRPNKTTKEPISDSHIAREKEESDTTQPHGLQLQQKLQTLNQTLAAVGPQRRTYPQQQYRPRQHHGPGWQQKTPRAPWLHGTHTLHYELMALSLEGTRKFEFRAQGYIDNEPFLRYDGYRRRAELWGPRIKGKGGAEIWTRETEDMQEKEEQLRRMLTEVMTQKGQNGGIHTLQATFGCETQGSNTGGFWRLGYDGQDFLTFDQKSQMWKVSVPSTHSTKTFWERHGPSVDQVKTFLNDTCPDRLQRYSIYLGNQLMVTGPPMVTVSRRPYPVGRITLTCWAFNLYTPVATLTWLQDGKPAQQHTFGPGTIFPSGNGTFQTWVSIWVLPGQEPHFTCRLRHRNKNIDVPTALGPQARNSGGATSSASALVASAFPAMLVFLACA